MYSKAVFASHIEDFFCNTSFNPANPQLYINALSFPVSSIFSLCKGLQKSRHWNNLTFLNSFLRCYIQFIVECNYFMHFSRHSACLWRIPTQLPCSHCSSLPQLNLSVYYAKQLTFWVFQLYFGTRHWPPNSFFQRYKHLAHLNVKWPIGRCSRTSPGNRFSTFDSCLAYLCCAYCFAKSDSAVQYNSRIDRCCTHPLIPFDFCYSHFLCIIPVQCDLSLRMLLANRKYTLLSLFFAHPPWVWLPFTLSSRITSRIM